MVSMSLIRSSNSLISQALPENLVAVFVGGTSGIGESTLKAFVATSKRPRVYIVGRSQENADRIIRECARLGPAGYVGQAEVVFLKGDVSSMKLVDRVCEDIRSRETQINLLFLSTGTPSFDRSVTPEGLHALLATAYYDRMLFTQHLTPLLIKASQSQSNYARVVYVAAGCDEGIIYEEDLPALKIPFSAIRGHLATLTTLTMEAAAARAPGVSFIHANPGLVRTPYQDRMQGAFGVFARSYMFLKKCMGTDIPIVESGERHLFLSTSASYAPGGVSLAGLSTFVGTDGKVGSGTYSVDKDGEVAGDEVQRILARYREEGMAEKVWNHVQGEYDRIRRE